MILAKPLPTYGFLVRVRNRATGEEALLKVEAVSALDAPAAGCHAAFVQMDWHSVTAWPPLTECWA